ncbi:MAG: methyltransferase domain-containing protein [Lachnospiraceae bacterium]|nr:methyltransferase domain-containing protein [Lachnospiraceae bacterium]
MHESFLLSAILKQISRNPECYENYIELGNYCDEIGNHNQAYLCYQNAVFFCQDKQKASSLKEHAKQYHEHHKLSISPLGIVIGTYNNLEYNKQCIESIRTYNLPDSYHIVIVDNASNDGTVEWLKEQPDLEVLYGDRQYGFPVAYNLGMKRLKDYSDILLLNNDTIVTQNALFCLRMTLYASDQTGAAGAMTNCVEAISYKDGDLNDPVQYLAYAKSRNIPSLDDGERHVILSGFAFVVRSKVIDEIGYLDEYFSPGYFEDNDYCCRILQAGYHLMRSPNARIFHYISKTFGTNRADMKELYYKNRRKFILKWKFVTVDADRDWPSLRRFLPSTENVPYSVLHIGSGLGEFLLNIKRLHPAISITGAESNPDVAEIASKHLPMIPFINERLIATKDDRFDFIFITDVMEHLRNPEVFIVALKGLLKENGQIILSVNNSMFYPSLVTLLSGGMPQKGLPLSQLLPLFTSNGFQADSVSGTSISFDENRPSCLKQIQSLFETIPSYEYSYQNYFIQLSLASETES